MRSLRLKSGGSAPIFVGLAAPSHGVSTQSKSIDAQERWFELTMTAAVDGELFVVEGERFTIRARAPRWCWLP